MMPDQELTTTAVARRHAPQLWAIWGGKAHVFSLQGRQLLGRPSPDSLPPELAVPVRSVSRARHGEFLTAADGSRYRDLGSTNGTLLNGKPVTPNSLYTLKDGDVLRIHPRNRRELDMELVLIYSCSGPRDAAWRTLPLTREMAEVAVGRNEGSAGGNRELLYRDTAVSRRHASFFQASSGWAIIDHGSRNGVFLNNKRIAHPAYLSPMDVVRISGYYFLFTGTSLLYQADQPAAGSRGGGNNGSSGSQGKLSISIEERNVWHRMKKQTLLKDIRLEIPTGNMVLVLGGSGAGKTTFMNAVMGYEKAQGKIVYNQTDIYAEYEKMKYEIGYVPQQDLLRMNDTVYNTLLNAAEMRLPARLSPAEFDVRVRQTMHLLGLERERDSLVGKLSGGQRKRLSIAVEYIGDPALFFLDEPDSGLDGTMARALMENLRTIADKGKIVIVISHSPDRAFNLFDKVIVLAKGTRDNCGHLVYYGSPKDACAYFETRNLEEIVKRINRRDEGGDGLADEYIRRYAQKEGKR